MPRLLLLESCDVELKEDYVTVLHNVGAAPLVVLAGSLWERSTLNTCGQHAGAQ